VKSKGINTSRGN